MNRPCTLRATAVASAVAVAVSMLSVAGATPSANTNVASNTIQGHELQLDRVGLSTVILDVWESEIPPMERAHWRDRMSARLEQSDLHNLRRAADALDYEQMLAALAGALPTTADEEQPQAIGDIDRDLTYTPVAPCRILDTRMAGGEIAGDSSRDFIGATASNFAAQGGADTDCNIPQGVAALSLNVTLVMPQLAGYATVYPFGVEPPLAASVNYTADSIVGNEVVVQMAQGEAWDFSIYTFGQAHVVADVSGYYMRPNATELDCGVALLGVQVAAGSLDTGVVTCSPGYSATGGGCSPFTVASARDLIVVASEPGFAEQWFCRVQNDGTVARTYYRSARCCRVPGR